MAVKSDRSLYLGPRLRRLRRELGLTQTDMASDLELSASYIALMERNQRPLTAEILLKLARTYRLDLSELAGADTEETLQSLQKVLKDPLFTDLELPALEITDMASNYPIMAEALLRLHRAWREEQLLLADHNANRLEGTEATNDPALETRRFLCAHSNYFHNLDLACEALSRKINQSGGLISYLKQSHGLKVRYIPHHIMMNMLRRFDQHRDEILIVDTLDQPSRQFQLAVQTAYIELRPEIEKALKEKSFSSDDAYNLTIKALANYSAAAILMPYTQFVQSVGARRYDIESLSREYGTSFEQTAHRLTTLQKPGSEMTPFFFVRVDEAGNVSKRLDSAGFSFAMHGGGCPIWDLHRAFQSEGKILTQWIELPDGQRFFSIIRTVKAADGAYDLRPVTRAIALACSAEHATKLIYTDNNRDPGPQKATPIGLTCQICHRQDCQSRSKAPIGRSIRPDDRHRGRAPFGF